MDFNLVAIALLIVVMMLFMTSGMPVPFSLGGIAILAILIFWDPSGFISVSNSI